MSKLKYPKLEEWECMRTRTGKLGNLHQIRTTDNMVISYISCYSVPEPLTDAGHDFLQKLGPLMVTYRYFAIQDYLTYIVTQGYKNS